MPRTSTNPVLRAVTFDGYRCFARPERLELRPLTLLYGRNSAGKSAAVRALAILGRSVAASARSVWELGSQDGPGRGASFRSLPHRGRQLHRFSVELSWELGGVGITDRFTLGQDDPLFPPALRELSPRLGRGPVWSWVPSDDLSLWRHRVSDTGEETELVTRGLVPARGQHHELDELATRLESLRDEVQWIHGSRSPAPREVTLTGAVPWQLDVNGADASLKLMMKRQELLPRVAEWYRRSAIGRDLRLNTLLHDGSAELLLDVPGRQAWRVSLADTGEGMGQVLPVLVAAAAAVTGTGPRILVVEDPEAHLHDDAVRALAEHLARQLQGAPAGCSFVFETHSETFLFAVQKAVQDGALRPQDVGIIWVDPQPDGHTKLVQAELDDQGFFLEPNPMAEAFRENGELASALAGLASPGLAPLE